MQNLLGVGFGVKRTQEVPSNEVAKLWMKMIVNLPEDGVIVMLPVADQQGLLDLLIGRSTQCCKLCHTSPFLVGYAVMD